MPDCARGLASTFVAAVEETGPMVRVSQAWTAPAGAALRWLASLAAASTLLLGACTGNFPTTDLFSGFPGTQPAGPQQNPSAIGTGRVKVGLILPLSASGNAGVAALSMRNAAE